MWAFINTSKENVNNVEYGRIIGIEPRDGNLIDFVHPMLHDRYIPITPSDNAEIGDRINMSSGAIVKPTPIAYLDDNNIVTDIAKLFEDEIEGKYVVIPSYDLSYIGKHYRNGTFEGGE